MTFQRDLAWKNLMADYQASISHKLARYAVSLLPGLNLFVPISTFRGSLFL